jgi:hypothetical protein
MFATRVWLLSAAMGSLLVGCSHDDRANAAPKATASAAPIAVSKPAAKRAPASGGAVKTAAKPATKPAAKPVAKAPTKPAAKAAPAGAVLVLKVPEAHLPPAGQCRIWKEDATAFQQPQARSCSGITPTAPAGSMILERPSKDTKIVRVRYIDAHRAGVVVRVRVFDASTGKYLRDEKV